MFSKKLLSSLTLAMLGMLSYSSQSLAYDYDCAIAMKGFRATGAVPVKVTSSTSTWLGGNRFQIELNVFSNPTGFWKNYYKTSNNSTWTSGIGSSTAAQYQLGAANCASGLVMTTQSSSQTLALAKGGAAKVTITPGPMGGMIDGQFALYDQSIEGFINKKSIGLTANSPTSNSSEDDIYNKKISFIITFDELINVPDGLQDTAIYLYVAGTSTWMPFNSGYSNWWKLGNNVSTTTSTWVIPLTMRVIDNKPVDPVIRCDIPTSVNFEHGTLSPDKVNGSTLERSVSIQCNNPSKGSIEIVGDDNSSASFASVNLGKGVYSQLSASADNSSWNRKLDSFNIDTGSITIKVKSTLSAPGKVESGAFSGSAVAIVKYL